MEIMNKHLAIAASLVIAALAGPAASLATAKTHPRAKTRSYKSNITSATLSTANGYPNPGGTALTAGTLKLTGFGEGAVVDRVKITSHPDGVNFMFSGTEVDFLAEGTWKSSFTGIATVQPDGSQALRIDGRFTGGTGKYRRAKGNYHFTGTVAPLSTVLTGQSTGSITF
jgi:hypothetical protein